jgi:sporulation integral membrane protein YlbJ
MGIASGYPVGARITSSLREQKLLTKNEAERLMAFSNNSGPLFIMGAVSVGMYNAPSLWIILLICHIAACITVGVIYGIISRVKGYNRQGNNVGLRQKLHQEYDIFRKNRMPGFGSILGTAITNSIMTILAIGGFIILFSVIINILLDTGIISIAAGLAGKILSVFGIDKDIISSILCGFFEITTCSSMSSSASGASLVQQLTATSAIIGWAGLSVHCQVFSIASKTDISLKPYLFGKFLQGVIAAVYTFGWIKIAGMAALSTKPASEALGSYIDSNWFNYTVFSLQYLVLGIAIILICIVISLITYVIRKP